MIPAQSGPAPGPRVGRARAGAGDHRGRGSPRRGAPRPGPAAPGPAPVVGRHGVGGLAAHGLRRPEGALHADHGRRRAQGRPARALRRDRLPEHVRRRRRHRRGHGPAPWSPRLHEDPGVPQPRHAHLVARHHRRVHLGRRRQPRAVRARGRRARHARRRVAAVARGRHRARRAAARASPASPRPAASCAPASGAPTTRSPTGTRRRPRRSARTCRSTPCGARTRRAW